MAIIDRGKVGARGPGALVRAWARIAARSSRRASVVVALVAAAVIVSGRSSRSVAQSTAGLVAAYGFNEGSGAAVADVSGNGLTGKIVGATWTTAGKYGQALSFN